MSTPADALTAPLARYLAQRIPTAAEVVVYSIERVHGGASRETYRCRVGWLEGGHAVERRLILRRDPPASLIETDRAIEYAAYRSFAGRDVPLPRALFLETDPAWLERPFFLMEMAAGSAANPFAVDPYGAHAERVGEQFWTVLGRIAATDPSTTELASVVPRPEAARCWEGELDRWERVLDEDELEPQPIVRAAIRWLRRHPPPPPARVAIVHGDYRSGNFLTDADGTIQAILDWEMCHLGDPHEDIGWACDPLWSAMDGDRPGQMIRKERALALWEAASGVPIDPVALRWWEIFAHVKGLAIWISSSKEYESGRNRDPVLLISSWLCTDRHNRILAARMQELAR